MGTKPESHLEEKDQNHGREEMDLTTLSLIDSLYSLYRFFP